MASKRKSKGKKSVNPLQSLRNAFGKPNYNIASARRDVQKLIDAHLYNPKSKTDIGKNTVKVLKRFKGFLEGSEQVLHIPKSEAPFYSESGFKTVAKRHVLVPVASKKTKVRRIEPTEEGMPQFETVQPLRSREGPATRTGRNTLVPYRSLKSYLRSQVQEAGSLQDGERYAYRYKGHTSYGTFSNAQQMLAKLEHYAEIEDAEEADEIAEEYQNIEVYKTTIDEHYKTRFAESKAVKAASLERARGRSQDRDRGYPASRRRREYLEDENPRLSDYRKARHAENVADQRDRETPEKRAARLAQVRAYKARKKK